MAIIVEEEKRQINWLALGMVILTVAVIGVVVYYLFFVPLPLIERVAPPRLQSLEELSNIKLEPEAVINNPKFRMLRQYVNPVEVGPAGKANPFIK